MTHLRLVWRLLLTRGMSHLLTVVVIALGTGMIVTAMATREAERTALSEVAARFPLVVGGEVGAVTLVLGSLTRLHDLGAGVDASLLHQLEADDRVEQVVPLLGGHEVSSYPLLGTSPGFLEPRSRFPLATGRTFSPQEMEVVLGSEAARGLGLSLGSPVRIEHRHDHAPAQPGELTVVGVLEPTGTVTDRTLLCPVEAIFHSHGPTAPQTLSAADDHGEHQAKAASRVSSLLVRPVDRRALLSLHEELHAEPGLEVALSGQTLRRLAEQLNMGGKLLRMVLAGVVLLTLLALLLSVYSSTLSQAREVAIMRVLGARRLQVLGVIGLSTSAVVGAGLLSGVGLAALLARATERLLRQEMGLQATVQIWSSSTLSTVLTAAVLLSLVGIQPAIAAYRVQAAEALDRPAGSGHATRSYLRWSLRILVPLAILIGVQVAMSQHGAERASPPLQPESAELFRHLAAYDGGPLPPPLAAAHGTEQQVEGYMYDLGDPYVVQDFYLVAMDPRLPRCPFCYRAPTSRERILVQSGGRELDVTSSLVKVTGVLQIDPSAEEPYVLQLQSFDVVLAD